MMVGKRYPDDVHDKKLRVGMHVLWQDDPSIRGIITHKYILDNDSVRSAETFFDVKWLSKTLLTTEGWYGIRFVPEKGQLFAVWNGKHV